MSLTRAACLLLPVLLLSSAVEGHDGERPDAESFPIREVRLEHANVNTASQMVRGLLNLRKCASDERRQVLIISDTPEVLDRAVDLLASIDAATDEWNVTLSARSGAGRSVLRTALITEGHLDLRFGHASDMNTGSLELSASLARLAAGEVDLDWSSGVTLIGQWTESARARETLHDRTTVTLVSTPDPARQKALARLLGLPGSVDAVVLEVAKAGAGLPRE